MRKSGRLPRGFIAWVLALGLCLAAALALSGGVWPDAPGTSTRKKGDLTIDNSNAADGYVMAKAKKGNKRLKLRVSLSGQTLTYDINADGEYEAFPLQLGAGEYGFELFRNVEGNKYAQAGSVKIDLAPADDTVAFLSPNPYVPYGADSQAVRISEEICAGLTTDREKLEAVRDYVRGNFVYDYVKAATITSGAMPDIDGLIEKRMGICQDLSALVACMLRVQGIPTQMVIGYANKNYHAWNSVLIDGQYQQVDLTAELNAVARNVTYTVERFY